MSMTNDKRWVRVTHCANIPLRQGRAVRLGHREIAIFNLGSRFLAVDNRCPHKAGPLSDGIVSGETVVCPLHAWKVNLETGKVANPNAASNCVETFPTRVEDGMVLVGVPTISPEEMSSACVEHREISLQLNSETLV